MHIPDGYLSPQTCAAAYAVAVPFWAIASRRVSAVVKTRDVPMLAMFAGKIRDKLAREAPKMLE